MSADILGTNSDAWFNKCLRPRKAEGSLGRTAQDGHFDSHSLLVSLSFIFNFYRAQERCVNTEVQLG